MIGNEELLYTGYRLHQQQQQQQYWGKFLIETKIGFPLFTYRGF